jgi:hypothetical protein
MMRRIWELVRIEIQYKWPFVAILLGLWMFLCLGARFAVSIHYPTAGTALWDLGMPIAHVTIFLNALVLGAALFQPVEKDGVHFFLYHHPVKRRLFYSIRYLTGVALIAALTFVTILATPLLFQGAWATPYVDVLDRAITIAATAWLLYSVAAFFALLFSSELITIPVAIGYSVLAAGGLAMIRALQSGTLRENHVVVAFSLVAASALLVGDTMFIERRILEASWRRRAIIASVAYGVTALILVVITFVDIVDLLYLIGIDVPW